LPISSRYRFLLDDARFFIEGFIKGPVCRGQVALNVIEDRFWILFFEVAILYFVSTTLLNVKLFSIKTAWVSLIMMLTGAESIRDVILFPLLRPKRD